MGGLKSDWLKDALTGPDNQTVAIGRLLGAAMAVVLVLAIPVTAVASVISGQCDVDSWRELFGSLGLYVPLVIGAITGLIWGTNPTEPKPPHKEGNEIG
jgi:hypothetical protein